MALQRNRTPDEPVKNKEQDGREPKYEGFTAPLALEAISSGNKDAEHQSLAAFEEQ